MEDIIQEQRREKVIPPLVDKGWKSILLAIFVVGAPIFNFSFIELMKPEWQDGRFESYIYLFLLPESSIWFILLLTYAIISYLLLLLDNDRFAASFIVRLGVYSGTFLALQYGILSFATSIATSSAFLLILFAYFAPLIVPKIYRWIRPYWDKLFKWNRIVAITIPLIIVALLLWGYFFVVAIFGLASPFWSFLIAFQASRWLWTHHESKLTLPRGLGIFAWVSAYAFALRFDILKMFELYNAMPTEPPNCYIATAASKGHPNFVGSQEVTLANGTSMRLNRQLQRLKAVEIAWMGVSAQNHRMMRRVYDVIGRWLAAHIQNPLFADIAYLVLIPVEAISFFGLKLIVPEIQSISERLYRSS
jgi:hypothetical protein